MKCLLAAQAAAASAIHLYFFEALSWSYLSSPFPGAADAGPNYRESAAQLLLILPTLCLVER